MKKEKLYTGVVRKFISIIVVFALVVTIGFPNASHALMEREAKSTQKILSAEKSDCHKNEQVKHSQKIVQKNKADSDKCCDKGICNCIGNTCHNGLSKILNNGTDLTATSSSNVERFVLSDDHVESSFSSRLKRPPKA